MNRRLAIVQEVLEGASVGGRTVLRAVADPVGSRAHPSGRLVRGDADQAAAVADGES